MPFIITNEQGVLTQKPNTIHPRIKAHCDAKGEWTIMRKPKKFPTRAAARKFLAKGGLTEGRHEDAEANRFNLIAIEEAP